jgi:8-oxo-dGTP pyrophosphatase MutT (NUDIX family)
MERAWISAARSVFAQATMVKRSFCLFQVGERSDGSFQKGTLEPGEKPHKCAEREAGEEAGIIGKANRAPMGYFTYVKETGTPPFIVNVFRLRVESVAKHFREEGQREFIWVSPGEAAQMVLEPELQSIFRRFANEASTTAQFT